jgi:hypothetical protein
MTDAAELPPTPTAPVIKRWRVELAGKATCTVEARGFRVECGALVLVQPAGCLAWLSYKAITGKGPPLGLTIVCA